MTTFRSPWMALCGGLAVLALAPAHAYIPTVYYQGSVTAQHTEPRNIDVDTGGATTKIPATYHAVSGANTATSTTSNVHGGSAYSAATATTVVQSDGYAQAGGSGANTLIVYNPYLMGPSGPLNLPIPVRVQASGYVDGAPFSQATATFILNYPGGGTSPVTLWDRARLNIDGSGRHTFSIDEVIYIQPLNRIDLLIQADASAVGPTGHAGSSWATAFVDPVFTIDPAYAADYKFVGLPESAVVPEPASMALLLPGLLVIALARRRAAS